MARYFKRLELISLNSLYFILFYVFRHVGWHVPPPPPPRVFRYSAFRMRLCWKGLHWVVFSLLPNPYLHSSGHSDIRPLHKSFTKLLLKVGLPFDWFHRRQMEPITKDLLLRNQNMFSLKGKMEIVNPMNSDLIGSTDIRWNQLQKISHCVIKTCSSLKGTMEIVNPLNCDWQDRSNWLVDSNKLTWRASSIPTYR